MRLVLAFIFVSCPLAAALITAQAPAPSSRQHLGASSSTRSIARPTPAPTSTSSRAAAGSPNNPMPADRSTWGRFDELQERNNETLRQILEAAAAGRDPASKKIGDYYASCMDEPGDQREGRGAARSAAEEDRGAAGGQRARAARRGAAHDRRQRVLRLRLGARLQGRVSGDGDRRSGRPRPARSRLLLQGRSRSRSSCGNSTSSTSAGWRALLGAPPEQARRRPQSVMKIETALAKGALDASRAAIRTASTTR